MAIKVGPRRYVSTGEMVSRWKDAWDEVGGSNPYSVRMDKVLKPHGFGVHDIKTRLGLIRAKRDADRTEDEAELLMLDGELKFVSEQGLFDKCSETVQGSIFLLESKFGYRKNADVNVNLDAKQVKKVVRWGDEETQAPELRSGEEVAKEAAEG